VPGLARLTGSIDDPSRPRPSANCIAALVSALTDSRLDCWADCFGSPGCHSRDEHPIPGEQYITLGTKPKIALLEARNKSDSDRGHKRSWKSNDIGDEQADWKYSLTDIDCSIYVALCERSNSTYKKLGHVIMLGTRLGAFSTIGVSMGSHEIARDQLARDQA
jgi:hypothetical protein